MECKYTPCPNQRCTCETCVALAEIEAHRIAEEAMCIARNNEAWNTAMRNGDRVIFGGAAVLFGLLFIAMLAHGVLA